MERTNQNGAVSRFGYDSRGNTISQIDPLGNETTFAYDLSGNQISVTDPNGATTSNSFNTFGQLIGQTDSTGASFSYALNQVGEVVESETTLVNSEGSSNVSWQYSYDANQNPVSELLPGLSLPSTATYDSNNQLSGSVNSVGTAWAASRTALGNVESVVSAGATALSATYDVNGRVRSLGADDYGTVAIEYDALGNETLKQPPEMDPIAQNWDAVGQLTSESDAAGNTVQHLYDERGSRIKTIRPDGEQRNIEYDAGGRITRQFDSSGIDIRYEYDSADQVVAITGSDGVRRETTYDPAGRVIRNELGLGEVWNYEYDDLGRIAETTTATGMKFGFDYDSLGFVETMKMPNEASMSFRHDALGRLMSHTLPLGQKRELEYDDVGRVVRSVKFDGTDISLAYSDTDRLLIRTVAGEVETYGYDRRGRVTSYDSGGFSAQTQFDGLGRLARWTNMDGVDTRYVRDGNGHVTSISTPNGMTASSYDIATRRETLSYDGIETLIDRNALGIPTELQFAEGIDAVHTYDGAGRAIKLSYLLEDAIVREVNFTFDSQGRIARKAFGDGTSTAYSYDLEGRLSSEINEDNGIVIGENQFVFDGNGNISRRTENGVATEFDYDANDRLISAGNVRYTWDANGNRVSIERNDLTERFSYDSQDRLVQYSRGGDEPVQIVYTYHHDGLLLSRTRNGVRTVYSWDRSLPELPMLLEITDGDGDLIARFFNDGLFLTHSVDAQDSVTTYLRDHLGSVIATVRAGIVTPINYDAFGQQIGAPNFESEIGYTNSWTDPDTQLVFMRSRWYDPESASFLSADSVAPDPLRPRTINRYAYVGGDPVNRFDPSGQNEFRIANVIVSLSIASVLLASVHIIVTNGPEEIVAGGFGVRRIYNTEARGPDAVFAPAGVTSANLNAWGIGFSGGLERLQFISPESKERANYLFFGPSFTVPNSLSDTSIIGGGITQALIGLGSGIYNTPRPENYRGWFVSASGGGSVTRSIMKKIGKLGFAGSASAFWSPTPTYFVNESGEISEEGGESRYSFGYRKGIAITAGRGPGGRGAALSFSLAYYWLMPW